WLPRCNGSGPSRRGGVGAARDGPYAFAGRPEVASGARSTMRSGAQSALRRNLGIAQRSFAPAVLLLVLGGCSSPTPPEAAQFHLAWRAHLDGAVDGTAAVAGGMVFAGSAGGELAAFDLQTGERVWLQRGLGAISDSPAV